MKTPNDYLCGLKCIVDNWRCQAHDTAIRNATLDEILKHLEEHHVDILNTMDMDTVQVFESVIAYLESLRTNQEPHQ